MNNYSTKSEESQFCCPRRELQWSSSHFGENDFDESYAGFECEYFRVEDYV
jgi:hypothetical protein